MEGFTSVYVAYRRVSDFNLEKLGLGYRAWGLVSLSQDYSPLVGVAVIRVVFEAVLRALMFNPHVFLETSANHTLQLIHLYMYISLS